MEQKTAASKLRRLASIGICRAMHSCPTIGLKAKLNILPLSLVKIIEAKRNAAICAPKLECMGANNGTYRHSHQRILKEFPGAEIVVYVSDVMFKLLFLKIEIHCKAPWGDGHYPVPKGSLVYYPHGSRKKSENLSRFDWAKNKNHGGPKHCCTDSPQAEVHITNICVSSL